MNSYVNPDEKEVIGYFSAVMVIVASSPELRTVSVIIQPLLFDGLPFIRMLNTVTSALPVFLT